LFCKFYRHSLSLLWCWVDHNETLRTRSLIRCWTSELHWQLFLAGHAAFSYPPAAAAVSGARECCSEHCGRPVPSREERAWRQESTYLKYKGHILCTGQFFFSKAW
jgi:hypothetical protein